MVCSLFFRFGPLGFIFLVLNNKYCIIYESGPPKKPELPSGERAPCNTVFPAR